MIFSDNKQELDFVIHEHSVGDEVEYQLSLMTGDDQLQFLRFPRTGKMATISDVPNVVRLYGTLSEDTRSTGWLSYQGTTDKPETIEVGDEYVSLPGVYRIHDRGTVKLGEQTPLYSEIYFNGDKLTDRWVLRQIPNIFDKSLFDEDIVYLLWKPPIQKSFNSAYDDNVKYETIKCSCPNVELSENYHDIIKEEGEYMLSKMTTDIMFNTKTQEFEGISAAEGTWTDLFGEKYTYTKEFLVHNYNEQRARLASGEKITINTEHPDDDDVIEGTITSVQLYQKPIYHIKVKGIYKGPVDLSDRKYGLSYEFRLRSVWNSEFDTWVPYESITEKISIVKRPACKICWINKVK